MKMQKLRVKKPQNRGGTTLERTLGQLALGGNGIEAHQKVEEALVPIPILSVLRFRTRLVARYAQPTRRSSQQLAIPKP